MAARAQTVVGSDRKQTAEDRIRRLRDLLADAPQSGRSRTFSPGIRQRRDRALLPVPARRLTRIGT